MTLLETLATLVVLSIFIFGGGAWIISANRTAQAVSASSHETMIMVRAFDSIRADLVEAEPESIILDVEDNAIRAITTRCAPGKIAGWRQVQWRYDNGSLIRFERVLPDSDDTETLLAVLVGVESFTVSAVNDLPEVHSEVQVFAINICLRSGMPMQRLWRLGQ